MRSDPGHLLRSLREADVRFDVVEGRLRVDAPAGRLTEADRVALRQHRDELVAILVAEVRHSTTPVDLPAREVLAVFPGATIVPSESWPPPGAVEARAWLAGSKPTVDFYGPERPSAPCNLCGSSAWWHQRGTAWLCAVCHPDPTALRHVVAVEKGDSAA